MIEHLLGPVFKMIGFDYKNKRAKDKVLLEQFLAILPSDSSSIEMLKNTDMGASIPSKNFVPLDNVASLWEAPDKDFQVAKLQHRKISFISSLKQFLDKYAQHSAAAQLDGFLSIGLKDYEDRPEMIQIRAELNSLARDAYRRYEELVRTAKSEI